MRKKISLLGILFLLVVFFVIGGCGKKAVAETDIPKYILDTYNKVGLGMVMDADPEKGEVVKQERGSYLVTFRNPRFTFDLTVIDFPKYPKTMDFKMEDFNMTCESVTFAYTPKPQKLVLKEMKGIRAHQKYHHAMSGIEKSGEKPGGDPSEFFMNYSVSCRKWVLGDVNLIPLLKMKSKNFWERIGFLAEQNRDIEQAAEGVTYEISANSPGEKNNSIKISTEKCVFCVDDLSRSLFSMYDKQAPVPDFEKFVKKGKPLLDSTFKLEKMTVKVAGSADVSLDYLLGRYCLGPGKDRKYFTYENRWEVKGLKVDVMEEGSEDQERFFDMKDVGLDIRLDRLNPKVVTAYFSIIKKLFSLEEKDSDRNRDIFQEMDMMTLATDFFATKPELTVLLDPGIHGLASLKGRASLVFKGLTVPDVNGYLTLFDVAAVKENLGNQKDISADDVKELLKAIEDYFVVRPDGSGKMTFKTENSKFLVNGKSVE